MHCTRGASRYRVTFTAACMHVHARPLSMRRQRWPTSVLRFAGLEPVLPEAAVSAAGLQPVPLVLCKRAKAGAA